MAEIDWEALLEGKEPDPVVINSDELTGLQSINSDISISASTQSRDKSHDLSDAGSFINLQSVNDLIGHSPSPEIPYSRSATSIKSNVTFSESEPEVFNIADEMNLMSIGELSLEEEIDKSGNYSLDKFTDDDTRDATPAPESVIEDENNSKGSEDEITEDIKTRSDGWKQVKDKLLNKGKKIPIFMVAPKKKKLSKDLSFSRSMDKSELSQLLSRKASRSSVISEASSRKSSVTEKSEHAKSYNYTSYTEDITTVSETSSSMETFTKSQKSSVTKLEVEAPCCKCKCKNQVADLNMRPIPIFSGVTLDPKTLNEISAMNPDKIALLNMMKSQFELTKGLIDITTSILDSEVDKCRPTKRYTDFRDTKKYITKHQPYKKKDRKKRENRISRSKRQKSEGLADDESRHSEKSEISVKS